jgi:predicted nucleic acid-binding protein
MMPRAIFLDAGPLGMLVHPRRSPEIAGWLRRLVGAGAAVWIPEIADYEVRRELLRINSLPAVRRLDAYKLSLGYVPITTAAMLKAAEFWAAARRQGRPTADAAQARHSACPLAFVN